MGSMRMAVSTRLFTPMAPRALLSASELMTVAHMPIWSPLHAVETLAGTAQATEYVAAADNDANLHAHFQGFFDLCCIFVETFHVNAISLFAHEALSAQLEQDAFEFCHNDIWLFVVVRKISVFIQDGKFSPSLFPLKPEYFLSDAADEQCLHQSAHAEVAEKGCPEPDVCLLAEEENGEERERGGRH